MQSTGEPWRLGRRPALDGIRGVAILLVLTTHLRVPGFADAPGVGVVVFFALSGFLITTLLLERRESLGRFYLRRAARLLPALAVCLAGYVLLELVLTGHIYDGRMIVAVVAYVGNWNQATGHYDPNSGVGHLWSLGTEEQFYVLWPLALLWVRRLPKPKALKVLALVIVASVLLRGVEFIVFGYYRAYYGLGGRIDELMIGCALALFMHGRREGYLSSRWALPALVGVVALSWSPYPLGSIGAMPTLAAALTAVMIFVGVNGGVPWLATRWLRWFGQRSYAIYLYHLPIRWAVEQFHTPWWVTAPVVLAITLPLAEASWRFVESPILGRVRRRTQDREVALTTGGPARG